MKPGIVCKDCRLLHIRRCSVLFRTARSLRYSVRGPRVASQEMVKLYTSSLTCCSAVGHSRSRQAHEQKPSNNQEQNRFGDNPHDHSKLIPRLLMFFARRANGNLRFTRARRARSTVNLIWFPVQYQYATEIHIGTARTCWGLKMYLPIHVFFCFLESEEHAEEAQ